MVKEASTLLSITVAKVGYEFIFYKNDKCFECKFRSICMNRIVDGRVYRVKKVINTMDNIFCPLTDSKMVLVKVELADLETTIVENLPLAEKIIIKRSQIDCKLVECKYKEICFPKGLYSGDKIKIIKINQPIGCPLNFRLRKIIVKPVL